ncbi:hypothetical protein ACFOZ1_14125 [Gracilibacillus marinus]|uniref:Glycine zipper-like domain-containing protein n=1 Tax=Gracilibacillus marinus TaxID=630535 RepID=A0ABV8VZ36_9BACI
MDHTQYEQLVEKIDHLHSQLDKKQAQAVELDLLKRITIRLDSFDCTVCTEAHSDIEEYVHYLEDHNDAIDKERLKDYRKRIEKIKTHLLKEHGLIEEGYYLSIYMSIGMSFGLIFGMIISDNLALGLPIGLAIGLAIGVAIDADYKKKGKTL